MTTTTEYIAPFERTFDVNRALTVLLRSDYDLDTVINRLVGWVDDGNAAVIFENHDLSHPEVGHVIALAAPPHDIPRHGPDHPSIGLGWRYIPVLVIDPLPEYVPTHRSLNDGSQVQLLPNGEFVNECGDVLDLDLTEWQAL